MTHSTSVTTTLSFLPKIHQFSTKTPAAAAAAQFKSFTYNNDTHINNINIQTQTKTLQNNLKQFLTKQSCGFCKCGRRHFLVPAIATTLLLSFALDFDSNNPNYMDMINNIRPPRADWYEELFASVMNYSMKGYESEIGRYKHDLFSHLKGQAKEILEIGIGTGPNLKYYASDDGVHVIGVDPNRKMEKYARQAAEEAGLAQANFDFVHAVGEILPVKDASVDAVIGTLVLCSVKDVDRTLQEVKRVLKPGGLYVFIEHVAAQDGTFLRLVQNILNPVQQLVADNCHLTRESERSRH
ncbi:uncharacterized protein LOC141598752 isoform X2 [Silene latifolia]|uniref:uncharacterized protein LOC141598752 isoform X2 n=1 Tax=Silene latifolia TaxID=37657 RepID=UPI003D781870